MSKKRYCQKCQNLIEEGKEIKFSEGSNYYSSRYSSGSRDYFTYWLCPKCYQQQQEEIKTKDQKVWQQVGGILLILLIILVVLVVLFLLFQHYQDRKIDRITKKAQKNPKKKLKE